MLSDTSQNLTDTALVDDLLAPQISWKLAHNFFLSYSAKKQTDEDTTSA